MVNRINTLDSYKLCIKQQEIHHSFTYRTTVVVGYWIGVKTLNLFIMILFFFGFTIYFSDIFTIYPPAIEKQRHKISNQLN